MSNIIVTEKNVKMISNHELLNQYRKLKRTLDKMSIIDHPEILSECIDQLELVKETLVRRGQAHQLSEQLVLPNLIPKKVEYEEIVIKKLRQHALNKVRLEGLKHRKQQGFELVFPSNISSVYHDSGASSGTNEYRSKSEQAILDLEKKKECLESEIAVLEEEIDFVEKTLDLLDPIERDILNYKYIHFRSEKTDDFIISRLPVSRSRFYELRNSALLKLAEAFNIL